jgi:hypothetical protein
MRVYISFDQYKQCNVRRRRRYPEAYETSAQTEKKVMHLVANVSLFDIACQFTTAECGDAAALQLAAALRADAEVGLPACAHTADFRA